MHWTDYDLRFANMDVRYEQTHYDASWILDSGDYFNCDRTEDALWQFFTADGYLSDKIEPGTLSEVIDQWEAIQNG